MDTFASFFAGTLGWFVYLGTAFGIATLLYGQLRMPAYREGQARILARLLEFELQSGSTLENSLANLAQIPDKELSNCLRQLRFQLGSGQTWTQAIAQSWGASGHFGAFLDAGKAIADVPRMLRSYHQLKPDTESPSRTFQDYFYVLFSLSGPVCLAIVFILNIYVFPKFEEIYADMAEGQIAVSFQFLRESLPYLLAATSLITLIFLAVVFVQVASSWSPRMSGDSFDRLFSLTPWARKRALRDFTLVLGILLDEGIPEEQAVLLAGRCANNKRVARRAQRMVEQLREGVSLEESLATMDPTHRLKWHFQNATGSSATFSEAFQGLNDSLDARAYQQEQAASQLMTTGVVLWNGALVLVVCHGALQPLWDLTYHLAVW